MIELIALLPGVLERGLIFSLVVASVYLSSKRIRFDNLAIEGAFGLGGAITAFALIKGMNPWITLLCAATMGIISGMITGLLATKLKLNNLITGIVVTSAAFSISLKIAGSNMTLAGKPTIFSALTIIEPYNALLLSGIITGVILGVLSWFLKTEIGFLLSTLSDNPQMLTNLGKNKDWYMIGGLALSNSLAAIGGALFVHYAGYFSIWTSVGMLIIGLAGMILAQSLSPHFGLVLIIGSCIYQCIIALTLELQLDPDLSKLITALLIVILLTMKQQMKKIGK